MHRLINAIGFQVGWFICIAAVRNSLEIPALLTCSVLIGIHFFYTNAPLKDFKLSLVCLALGIVIDSSLQYFSVISFLRLGFGTAQSVLALDGLGDVCFDLKFFTCILAKQALDSVCSRRSTIWPLELCSRHQTRRCSV